MRDGDADAVCRCGVWGVVMSWQTALVITCLLLFALWALMTMIDDFGDDE